MRSQETRIFQGLNNHEYTDLKAEEIVQQEFEELLERQQLTREQFFNMCKYIVDGKKFDLVQLNKKRFCQPKILIPETEENVILVKPLLILEHLLETLCSLVTALKQEDKEWMAEQIQQLEEIFKNSDKKYTYQTLIDFEIRGRKENVAETETQFNNILGVASQLKNLTMERQKLNKEQNKKVGDKKSAKKPTKKNEGQIKLSKAKDPRGNIFERIKNNKCQTPLSKLYEEEKRNYSKNIIFIGK